MKEVRDLIVTRQKPLRLPPRREAVSSTLHQNIENEAMLVDRAPKPVGLASDREDGFILPFVAARRSTLADLVGERLTEFVRPLGTVL